MDSRLHTLLQHPLLWQTGMVRKRSESISTGFDELDARLPGGGWPAQGMVEVLSETPGHSELALFLPAIRQVIGEGSWIALIAPPFEPYAPACVDGDLDPERFLVIRTKRIAWTVEQVTRAAACRVVFAWPERMQEKSLRRLQVAAEQKHVLLVMCRHLSHREHLNPAALRLTLANRPQGFELGIFKSRGGRAGKLSIAWPAE